MTNKNERNCWSCGSKDLDNMGDHIKCRACGATWNELPHSGSDAIGEERDYVLSPEGSMTIKSGSPSSGIKRRASAARDKARA